MDLAKAASAEARERFLEDVAAPRAAA